jgi:uncharacterized protein (TIRG00374 family)
MVLLGFAASAAAVAYLAHTLELAEVGRVLGQGAWPLLVLGVLFTALAYAVSALRWQVLLGDEALPAWRLGRILMVGHFANVLLPLRAGDLLRPWLIKRASSKSYALALSTIVVERLLDVMAVVFFGALVLLGIEAPEGLRQALWVFGGACLAGAAVLVLVSFQSAQGSALRLWLERAPWAERLALPRHLTRLFAALEPLRSGRALLVAAGLSLLQWALVGAGVFACVSAFGLGLPWLSAVLLMVATNLGSALPSAPAAVGVYHAVGVVALRPWGVPPEAALAVVTAAHLTTLVLQLGLGALATWAEVGALAVWRALPRDDQRPNMR